MRLKSEYFHIAKHREQEKQKSFGRHDSLFFIIQSIRFYFIITCNVPSKWIPLLLKTSIGKT